MTQQAKFVGKREGMKISILFALALFLPMSCEKVTFRPTRVVITIDDAPAFPENTLRMLEVLDKHHAEATFFCIGHYLELFPDIADSIAKKQIVGNHTYLHLAIGENKLADVFASEIGYNQLIIDGLLEKYNKPCNRFFRAPYSSISKEQQEYLKRFGYRICWWNYDAEDWKPEVGVPQIIDYSKRVLEQNIYEVPIFAIHISDKSVTGLDSLLYLLEN
jgi:peptidoglycan-N-acetylglucosamine deacetylase